ncbi:MAG: DUF4124 domain-containing protein [Betaproteobacteria bacterium]
MKIQILSILLLCSAGTAHAQVYRWVDAKGTVHYSDAPPPGGVSATKLDIATQPGPPSADTRECYTVRCQGERMEERIRRRDEADARAAAERAATAPKPVRGLEFRKYISIQRGMSEGELLTIAGEPDFVAYQGTTHVDRRGRGGFELRTWTYLPTVADPFTTTITLVGGRVGGIERVRKF